jgi:exodeoxyribonuclease-3
VDYRAIPTTGSVDIEAVIEGIVIGCLYLPNGNPAPGPKFDYKLRWFERLKAYAAELLVLEAALIGDFNIMPTDLDVHAPERWRDDALFRPETRAASADLVAHGWTGALRQLYVDHRITRSKNISGMRLPATQA